MTAYPKRQVKRSKGRARPDEPLAEFCQVGVFGVCQHRAVHRHHRLTRAQGGSDEAANTADVCSACHDHIHAQPGWSYRTGWLLHREEAS